MNYDKIGTDCTHRQKRDKSGPGYECSHNNGRYLHHFSLTLLDHYVKLLSSDPDHPLIERCEEGVMNTFNRLIRHGVLLRVQVLVT